MYEIEKIGYVKYLKHIIYHWALYGDDAFLIHFCKERWNLANVNTGECNECHERLEPGWLLALKLC